MKKFPIFHILLTVHLATNSVKTNLMQFFMYLFIHFISLHVSSIKCSSSGNRIVLIHHLVWLVCVSDCLVCRSGDCLVCRSWPAYQTVTHQTTHTRWCINTIRSPDDEHLMLWTCREMKWTNKYMKNCIKMVINRIWRNFSSCEEHGASLPSSQEVTVGTCTDADKSISHAHSTPSTSTLKISCHPIPVLLNCFSRSGFQIKKYTFPVSCTHTRLSHFFCHSQESKFIQEAKLQQHIQHENSDNNGSRKIPYKKLNELSAVHQHKI